MSNSFGIIQRHLTVEVLSYLQDVPKLVEQSENLTLIEGMTASFHCRFSADLIMVQHWLRPAEALRIEGGKVVSSNDPIVRARYDPLE